MVEAVAAPGKTTVEVVARGRKQSEVVLLLLGPERIGITLGSTGPIRWIGAGSLAPIGRLVQRAIQGDIVEVEADDPVEGGKCLGLELLEHACMDPFITSARKVVSDTWWSRIASTSTHDPP